MPRGVRSAVVSVPLLGSDGAHKICPTDQSVMEWHSMTTVYGDFDLTADELRAVTKYSLLAALDVIGAFERACPNDSRPRTAIDAAQAFIDGAWRNNLQRVAALNAHRAAKAAPTEVARLSARAAGDAAAAAYLHPIAKGTQVGHILRAAASAVRIAEVLAGEDPVAARLALDLAQERATPVLLDVLRRYPPAPEGRSKDAQLMSKLDASLRAAP